MEIINLGKADGLLPVDWAAVVEKLDAGSAPAADAANSRTTWLSTVNEDGSPHVTAVGVVAQLSVGNSLFWVENESPPHGNFSPETVGGATARMLLIVDDPESILARAVAEGATAISPVGDEHGWRSGRIDDPFGRRWEIGKPVNDWPPAGNC